MTSFEYQPLDDADTIRCMILEAGQPEEPLSCILYPTKLADAGTYLALSYVWGDPNRRDATIMCNEAPLKITKSLQSALKEIRQSNESICIWADAVCINQKDPIERAEQVIHMASIYRAASNVIVHLGTDPEKKAGQAFEIATRLVDDHAYQERFFGDWNDKKRHVTLLKWLYSLPWFHRVWTTQEIGLAMSATFICGAARIEWDTLHQAFELLATRATSRQLRKFNFNPKKVSCLYLSFFQEDSFLSVLARMRTRQTSEQRDRVFATLHHAGARIEDENGSRGIVRVDYNADLQDIYIETAVGILTKSESLDFLSYVNYQDLSTPLPSWVPQWHLWPLTHLLPEREGHQYSASEGLSASDDEEDPVFEIYDKKIQVRGVHCDVIDWCLPKWTKLDLNSKPGLRIKQVWNKVEDRAFITYKYDILNTLVRTFAANSGTESAKQNFSSFWRLVFDDKPPYPHLLSPTTTTVSEDRNEESSIFSEEAWHALQGRKIFQTKGGYIGIGPQTLDKGDSLFVLCGGKVPFILRNASPEGYRLVGEAYVDGIMEGQVQGWIKPGGHQVAPLQIY
ncbi:HET-domain-containing protein [Periconia macrospinosa]|uniref:HET-domain-containing protein n=1 Tax=Periconia macrospinosa TaxID=97972 RepID=A0A2V1E1S4_9PLEO|nr:HET-domain-containing protein [Periconia macrospinosa]